MKMMRWGLLLASVSVLGAQDANEQLDTARKLLERDPAAALDYASKAAAPGSVTERWFWPVMLEAEIKLGRWEAAAEMGAVAVAAIESGRMFTRLYQVADEIKLRRLYASALERRGRPEDAKSQRVIAELLGSGKETSLGDSRAQAIVAAERASRVEYARLDLLATEGHQLARLFRVKDLEGNVVELHGQKGKIVIALFWATWCAPCMKELEALSAMYPQLRERVEVMAVNVDDTPGVVREFVKNRNPAYRILTSEGSEVSSYTTGATLEDPNIPQLYVIDRQGNIRFHLTGFEDDGLFAQRLDWMIAAVK